MKVLIVDDDAAFRMALRHLFEAKTSFEVVGEAASGEEALTTAAERLPDVVVMDVKMPGMSGAEATRELKKLYPTVHVLALSGSEQRRDIDDMLAAGASGYLIKSDVADELIYSLRAVWDGGSSLRRT